MSEDITPVKFKCVPTVGDCPSIHKVEGGYVIKGDYRAQGELISLKIPTAGDGESAVFWPDALLDAFVREYVAKHWLGKEE
jgi:hypothetical protein